MRALKNVQFCSSSRKARILTAGIHGSISRIARKLHFVPKFEPDDEIGQKGALCKARYGKDYIDDSTGFVGRSHA